MVYLRLPDLRVFAQISYYFSVVAIERIQIMWLLPLVHCCKH